MDGVLVVRKPMNFWCIRPSKIGPLRNFLVDAINHMAIGGKMWTSTGYCGGFFLRTGPRLTTVMLTPPGVWGRGNRAAPRRRSSDCLVGWWWANCSTKGERDNGEVKNGKIAFSPLHPPYKCNICLQTIYPWAPSREISARSAIVYGYNRRANTKRTGEWHAFLRSRFALRLFRNFFSSETFDGARTSPQSEPPRSSELEFREFSQKSFLK
jgi:hypothetical protein